MPKSFTVQEAHLSAPRSHRFLQRCLEQEHKHSSAMSKAWDTTTLMCTYQTVLTLPSSTMGTSTRTNLHGCTTMPAKNWKLGQAPRTTATTRSKFSPNCIQFFTQRSYNRELIDLCPRDQPLVIPNFSLNKNTDKQAPRSRIRSYLDISYRFAAPTILGAPQRITEILET